jgi:hypothetical protein
LYTLFGLSIINEKDLKAFNINYQAFENNIGPFDLIKTSNKIFDKTSKEEEVTMPIHTMIDDFDDGSFLGKKQNTNDNDDNDRYFNDSKQEDETSWVTEKEIEVFSSFIPRKSAIVEKPSHFATEDEDEDIGEKNEPKKMNLFSRIGRMVVKNKNNDDNS